LYMKDIVWGGRDPCSGTTGVSQNFYLQFYWFTQAVHRNTHNGKTQAGTGNDFATLWLACWL